MNRPLFFLLTLLLACVPLAQAQRMAVTTASDEARSHFEQGRLQASHIQAARARTHFDAALAADPDFALAHAYRALVSPAAERAAHVQHAAAHAAGASEGERAMIAAVEARQAGDFDREIELLRGLAAQYPGDPNVPFLLGWRYFAQERYDEAEAAARQALAVDRDFAPVYNMLGYLAIEREDYAAAEEAFRDYVRLAPGEPNPYDSLGELYLITGRLDEAEPQFEQALARDPEFTVSRDNLVRVAVGRITDAWEAGARAGDGGAIAALYADDAVIHPANEPAAQGREALDAYFAASYGEPVDVTFTTVDVVVSGDLAYEVGASVSPAGAGKYLTIYRRIGDEWKIAADTWSDDAPVATSAAAGSN
jgi:tetratricopeptide (TPR) repeat protein